MWRRNGRKQAHLFSGILLSSNKWTSSWAVPRVCPIVQRRFITFLFWTLLCHDKSSHVRVQPVLLIGFHVSWDFVEPTFSLPPILYNKLEVLRPAISWADDSSGTFTVSFECVVSTFTCSVVFLNCNQLRNFQETHHNTPKQLVTCVRHRPKCLANLLLSSQHSSPSLPLSRRSKPPAQEVDTSVD